MATFKINISEANNLLANTIVRSTTSQFGGPMVTKSITSTQVGATVFLTFYIHPNDDYVINDISGITYTVNGGTPVTPASSTGPSQFYVDGATTTLSATLVNGLIKIDGIHQFAVLQNLTLNLALSGTAAVSLAPTPPGTGVLSSNSSISTNPALGIGNSYLFEHTRSIQIKHKNHFNVLNKNDDWAVSFWANIPPSQSLAGRQIQSLVQKRNVETYIGDDGLEHVRSNVSGQYPFDISFYTELHPTSPGHIFVRASDGSKTLNISSSAAYNDGTSHHYVFNKSGNDLSLHVDGVKDITSSYSFSGTVTNNNDILIGSRDITDTTGNFSGSMSQFRISRSAFNDSQITSLADNSPSGSALQREEVGYVFYKQGMVITSDPRYRYQNLFLGTGNWDYRNRNYELNYRATKTIEEVSTLCEIKKNEYNVSSNASLTIDGTDTDSRLIPMVTGSDFRPYITQVGLYNDNGDLLALAKLGAPLKKRQDVDVTINVRFDLD